MWTPLLAYVQVYLETDAGRYIGVDPSSVVEVGAPISLPGAGGLELGQALASGLAGPVSPRTGGSWATLEAAFVPVGGLLAAAGWLEIGREYEASWEDGDSVLVSFMRAQVGIEIEFFEWGDVVVYDSAPSETDEPSEPLVAVRNPTLEMVAAVFAEQGWS